MTSDQQYKDLSALGQTVITGGNPPVPRKVTDDTSVSNTAANVGTNMGTSAIPSQPEDADILEVWEQKAARERMN